MKIVSVVGATGTGKNDLALEIAKIFKGEIINFDSRQVYKGFPVITAQPTEEEKKICKHHLYGFLEIYESISAGEFSLLAKEKIKEVTRRDNLPILVGGTGLYLKAILFGLAPIPKIPPEVRKKIVEEYKMFGSSLMYNRLKEIDPVYAEKIHPRDIQRITRAMEIYEYTKKNITWYHKNFPTNKPKYNYLKIGIWMPREVLYKRLDIRISKMIEKGGISEVKDAWEKHPDRKLPIWTSIGGIELLDYVTGECSLEEARNKWLKNTKKYAKRQITWFKKEDDIKWFHYDELHNATKEIERFLND